MSSCPKCGTELRPNAKFCHRCGKAAVQRISDTKPTTSFPVEKGRRKLFILIFLVIITLTVALGWYYYYHFSQEDYGSSDVDTNLTVLHEDIMNKFNSVRNRSVYITRTLVEDDPNKVTKLESITHAEFLFYQANFSILAIMNMSDTAIVSVKNEDNIILVNESILINLSNNVPYYINVLIPLIDELGNSNQEYSVQVVTLDKENAIFNFVLKFIYSDAKYNLRQGNKFWNFLEENKFITRKDDPTQLIKLWNWDRNNIEYKTEVGDFAQTADLTFDIKTGDCEDRSILLATALEHYGLKDTKIVYADICDKDSKKKRQGHTFVKTKMDDKYWVIDTTGGEKAIPVLPYDKYIEKCNEVLVQKNQIIDPKYSITYREYLSKNTAPDFVNSDWVYENIFDTDYNIVQDMVVYVEENNAIIKFEYYEDNMATPVAVGYFEDGILKRVEYDVNRDGFLDTITYLLDEYTIEGIKYPPPLYPGAGEWDVDWRYDGWRCYLVKDVSYTDVQDWYESRLRGAGWTKTSVFVTRTEWRKGDTKIATQIDGWEGWGTWLWIRYDDWNN